MITTILTIFTIYSLTFSIRESSLLDVPRQYLMRRSAFFFKLLSCPYCTSFHTGYITYLITTPLANYNWRDVFIYAFGGALLGLIFNGVINKLYAENN
jgi:hypothetical protein